MTAKDGGSGGKTKLSKNLLQMKFMKRTALKAEVQEQEEQKKEEEDADHWTVPDLGHRERLVMVEQSYASFEDLKYGRMSFRGFNPAIEKLMKAQNDAIEDLESERKEKQDAVSDDEMTERYNSLIHTMNKKFTKKNERKTRRDDHEQQAPADRRKRNRKFEKAADRARQEEEAGPSPPKRKREFKKPAD